MIVIFAKEYLMDLYRIVSLHYEKLSGNKQGLSSIRATGKYRIEFEEISEKGEEAVSICNIVDLSKHYE